MRKHCNRKARRALCPTMVALSVSPEAEMSERMALVAIAEGWAGPSQFNTLLDCTDLLLLAAADRKDVGVSEIAHFARAAMASMAERYKVRRKVGVTGDELKTLRVLVDVSEDFWKRKSGALFADAYQALDKFRTMQEQGVEA